MARPGAKEGSRAKSRREPPKDKRIKTSTRSSSCSDRDSNASSSQQRQQRGSKAAPAARKPAPCPEMRRIFTDAQQMNKVNHCIERMAKLMQKCDKKEAVEELKNCIKIAIRTDADSTFTKPLLDFVCRFLILQAKAEKDEPLVQQVDDEESDEESDDDESDDEVADELSVFCPGPSKPGKWSSRVSGKTVPAATKKSAAKRKPKAKKKAPKPVVLSLTTLDIILRDVLIRGMTDESVTVSINCLIIVRRVMQDVDDVSDNVYSQLRGELVSQVAKKNAGIRAAAIKALHRFQELTDEDDVVTCAMTYHLNNDPDFKVRQAVIQVIEPSSQSVEHIMTRTRDVKDIVRKAAYHKIAERINIKNLSIEQRLSLLRNGLNDRSPSVKKSVERVLVVSWLKACKESVIELLGMLDIESDPKTIDQLLHLIFRSYMSQTQGDQTKLHLFVKQFEFMFLNPQKLLMKKPLTVENAFLWRSLAYFLKEQGDLDPLDAEVDDKAADNYETEIDEMFAKIELKHKQQQAEAAGAAAAAAEADPVAREGPTPPKKTRITQAVEVDLLDYILPQLPHLCYYIRKFTKKINDNDFEELELADLDYVYEQLIKILLLVEIGDGAQEKILRNLIRDVIAYDKLPHKMSDVIGPLMQVVAKNVCKTPDELLQFTQDLTQEIHNSIFEAVEEQEKAHEMEVQMQQRVFTPHEIREIEMSYAKASVALESARDEMDALLRDQNYMAAEQVKQKLIRLEKERDACFLERNAARGNVMEAEPVPSSQTQQQKPEELIQDHPVELQKCLQIFSACLEFGNFKAIESVIQSHVDKICFSGMLSESPDIRRISVKILGNCCCISKAFAKKYFALMVQVIQHDLEMVSVMALRALFDFICEHGIAEIRDTQAADDASDFTGLPDATDQATSTQNRSTSPTSADGEANVSDPKDSSNKTSQDADQAEDFADNLSALILTQLKTTSPEVQMIAVKGVAKLLFLGRISSTAILSQLILIWYNPKTVSAARQFLGSWFPLFAFADSRVRNSASGQLSFEEAFFPTLERVILMSQKNSEDRNADEFEMTSAQIDNLIGFVLNLMTEAVQVKLAISVCHKIIDLGSDDSNVETRIGERFLLKSLTSLVVDTGTKAQLKELKVLGEKIKSLIDDVSIRFTQASGKKLTKFFDRVDFILSHLKDDANSSQLGMPLTESQSTERDDADRTLREEGEAAGRPTSRASASSARTSGNGERDESEDGDETLIDYNNLSSRNIANDNMETD